MARFLWTQKEDIGPEPRFGHAMCHDSPRQRIFLFGGEAAEPFGDSWTWSGESWTQVADTGPSPRRDHAMCFDSARGVALLFGGNSNATLVQDTWSWDGEDWTQVEDTGPSARSGHAMAFDTGRSRVVLFGGDAGAGPLRDTWEWDGVAWTQVEDAGPPPRRHHALAYDLVRQRTILFGGEGADSATLRDTWEWDGGNWTQIDDIGPPACMRSSIVSTDAQLVLFGGLSNSTNAPPPTVFDDSWTLQAGQWTQRQDMGPSARWGHAMAFDAQRRTIVMFGGHSSAAFDEVGDLRRDTWEHAETEQPNLPGGGGGGPGGGQLAQLVLNPTASPPGQVVTAEVILVAPSQTTTVVTLAWVLQSDPSNTNLLGQLQIPPMMASGTYNFGAPAATEPVIVVAFTDPSTYVMAQLTII